VFVGVYGTHMHVCTEHDLQVHTDTCVGTYACVCICVQVCVQAGSSALETSLAYIHPGLEEQSCCWVEQILSLASCACEHLGVF
jgi:hypothetical protein